ncbi:SUMO E3 ligase Pli1 [Schizosaccharomyces pombe]|uniref:E3 SUMO-protein ligase pli1 n=1 Tax=Schizosaccharomyces pombe (strain 972 / ATCC 24843) TaxID=284812 RepID=PLI1_SCHPO|nr:SUMO E3 ligase Pli1 [Schizosaccharomyces pombe]O94451.3 RecName: Full=E3 SUMO-protein ligase pli1; AltName: Full=E3 SUMO-protein transferase plil [Schizosaccharomyces pombe 972h-]CAA22599.1 SUMO E3 ligase Pli1 [Schizosaccharomyces pombe]|eukprot:NP_593123.1 SUMO E3 ligase Pli1 [Schizosaccharomyces pombe]
MNQANFLQELPNVLKRLETGLIIPQLKDILRVFGLRLSGTKAELITRIKQLIERIAIENNTTSWEALKKAIDGDVTSAVCILKYNTYQIYSAAAPIAPPSSASGNRSYSRPFAPVVHSRIRFRKSPFYDILEQFNAPFVVPACVGTRNTISFSFHVTPPALSKLLNDPKQYRVYLFSTPSETIGFGNCLMEFPTPQMELRINNQVAHANYRRLKGKPGTTNPADITDLVSKYAGPPGNNVVIYYMNSTKSYSVVVCFVKVYTIENLVDQIKSRKAESKEKIIERIKNDNQDADIIATSTDISLKCPLSFSRISLPVRSVFCKHIQCFDASAFLEMNKQTPSWMCPVCASHIQFSDLIIDGFMQHILESTPSNSETITVDPEGNWKLNTFDEPVESSEDEFVPKEKVIELSDGEGISTMANKSNDQPTRRASTHNSGPPAKRKRESLVIDLTISDDDENVATSTTESPSNATKENSLSRNVQSPNIDTAISNRSTNVRHGHPGFKDYTVENSPASRERSTSESAQSSVHMGYAGEGGLLSGALRAPSQQNNNNSNTQHSINLHTIVPSPYEPPLSVTPSTAITNLSIPESNRTNSSASSKSFTMNDLILPPLHLKNTTQTNNAHEDAQSSNLSQNHSLFYERIPQRPSYRIEKQNKGIYEDENEQSISAMPIPRAHPQLPKNLLSQTAGPLWDEQQDAQVDWNSELQSNNSYHNSGFEGTGNTFQSID